MATGNESQNKCSLLIAGDLDVSQQPFIMVYQTQLESFWTEYLRSNRKPGWRLTNRIRKVCQDLFSCAQATNIGLHDSHLSVVQAENL